MNQHIVFPGVRDVSPLAGGRSNIRSTVIVAIDERIVQNDQDRLPACGEETSKGNACQDSKLLAHPTT